MSENKALHKYLQRHAEKVIQLVTTLPGHYQHSIVIPVFDEPISNITTLLGNLSHQSSILWIIIFNAPDNASDQAIARTQMTFITLQQSGSLLWQQSPLSLYQWQQHTLLLLDNCHFPYLPHKQGVGLARKMGADIAVALMQQQKITSPWIYNTDADVQLPPDYLQVKKDEQYVAHIYPYQHHAIPKLNYSRICYDLSLYYYLAGLHYASSPYAYHSIGSILCVHYHAYVKVHGFPKKSAGEDFYLLNKLRKTGKINTLSAPIIHIQARLSQRVPFGTGPALHKIEQLHTQQQDYLYYHPDVFTCLQQWLSIIPHLWTHPPQQAAALANYFSCHPTLICAALDALGIFPILQKAQQQSSNATHFERYLHYWFDAFKTLKFIHYLRDHGLPSQPWRQILSQAPFLASIPDYKTDKPSLPDLLQHLQSLSQFIIHNKKNIYLF